jgi:uncharacterized Zn finger protein
MGSFVRLVSNDRPVECPSCGNPMRFSRSIPRSGLPDLRTFECRECGVVSTEAANSRVEPVGV